MKLSSYQPKRVFAAGCVIWIGLSGREAAQSPGMTVVPPHPTVVIGQTVQFTANGAVAPTNVSAGGEYTCVRLPDGRVQCVGRNQFAQLGNGTIDDASTLGNVSDLNTAAQVIAGDEFACALLADGTAKCWGLGEKGQRGDGTFDQRALVPVPVSGLTGAVALAAGYNHTCALLADGTMQCWGDNLFGQLGNASWPDGSSVPVPVTAIAGAVAITTGAFHTCALLGDSTVRCWGQNAHGQLGDGTTADSATPVAVSNLTGAVKISGGGGHSCAVLVDGTAQCWGINYEGELGDGTWSPSSVPVNVAGITTASTIAAGWAHTCALLRDGAVHCWGQGAFGQLGNGTTQDSSSAAPVSGITGAIGITAGWFHHSCALLADSSVRCWGINEWGQFGNGTTTSSSLPVTMIGPGISWTSSNTAVAAVDALGRAIGLAPGITTITATDSSGATASTTLTVEPPRFVLTVSRSGLAADLGGVTSSPSGISCGTDCAESYTSGTVVTLTASPSLLFTGWSGCDSVSGAVCTVTVTSARSVTAQFVNLPF